MFPEEIKIIYNEVLILNSAQSCSSLLENNNVLEIDFIYIFSCLGYEQINALLGPQLKLLACRVSESIHCTPFTFEVGIHELNICFI
jgi:hypothetical protein